MQGETKMNIIHIKEPFWKYKAVGIAESKIGEGCVVMIDYKQKDGTYAYPGQYYVSKQLAKSCSKRNKRDTPTLRIIPIEKMEEI